MERTLPDSGKGLAEWWSQHGANDESFTSKTYAELIERARPAGERHASAVSISLDMKAATRAIKAVNGHWDFPVGGQLLSSLADS